MADGPIPVSITTGRSTGMSYRPAAELGSAAAEILSHLVDVVDREDRLESGSGEFRRRLAADPPALRRAIEESVLRALHMASDPVNHRILCELDRAGQAEATDLASLLGLPRLAVEQRLSDLVSAGLAAKVFASGRAAATSAGNAIVGMINASVDVGAAGMEVE